MNTAEPFVFPIHNSNFMRLSLNYNSWREKIPLRGCVFSLRQGNTLSTARKICPTGRGIYFLALFKKNLPYIIAEKFLYSLINFFLCAVFLNA
jgi:hypothetical protein